MNLKFETPTKTPDHALPETDQNDLENTVSQELILKIDQENEALIDRNIKMNYLFEKEPTEKRIFKRVSSQGEVVYVVGSKFSGVDPKLKHLWILRGVVDNTVVGVVSAWHQSGTVQRRITISPEFKGRSYAKPLLDATDSFLLEEPDFSTERIQNENFSDLMRHLQKTLSGQIPFDEQEIKRLVLEQKRWQASFINHYKDHPDLELNMSSKGIELPTIISIISSLEARVDHMNKQNKEKEKNGGEKAVEESSDIPYDSFWRGVELEDLIEKHFGDDIGPLYTSMYIKRKNNNPVIRNKTSAQSA